MLHLWPEESGMINGSTEFSLPRKLTDTAANKPLHVVHLIEALGPGGAERLLYTNLKYLQRQNIRSTVFTVFANATHWVEPIRQLGVTVQSLNCQGIRDLPAGAAHLRSWLRMNQTDLIHTHLWAANIIGRVAGRLAGVPVISSIHNPDHEPEVWADGAEVSRNKRQLARVLDRWTARYGCHRLVAVSEYVRQSARRHLHFPLERIDLLYNPIDADTFSAPAFRNRDQVWRGLGLPAESIVLLNVARVSPQKGQVYAVRALPIVSKQYPNVHLVLVGATTDSQWLAQLKKEIQLLGVTSQVHIIGPRSDVPDLLHACDIFVFPSLYEGLGIALIEAMAAGCACIACDTGPVPEVVSHGVNGLLVPPRDETRLAEAVCELLADPDRRASLAVAARQSALKRFQPQIAADKLISIYESVSIK